MLMTAAEKVTNHIVTITFNLKRGNAEKRRLGGFGGNWMVAPESTLR